jgi:YegS/Rv2252/BmrU family lipid kinase
MKHVFIINPAAGKGEGVKLIPKIEELFRDRKDDYAIEVTKRHNHAYEIAKEYSEKDICRIYSVGGDGTLNEVVNGVINTKSSVAVIPTGSGNDFIKSVENCLEPDNILKNMVYGSEREVDVVKVNEKYYINISSLGFDGDVAYNANKLKEYKLMPKKFCYLFSVLITFIKLHFCNLSIDIDNNKVKKECLLAVVANGKYYGGGMMPAPDADIEDGELDICIIEKMSILKILKLFPLLIKGKHKKLNEVKFYKGKKVKITSDKYISLNIDGDVEKVKIAEFEILTKGIKIIIPNKN